MSEPLVFALLSPASPSAPIAAGFEEEGVPLVVESAEGAPESLARHAAKRALFGLGIGGDGERLALVLAAAPGRPYLEASATDARAFAHAAACVAANRPLRWVAGTASHAASGAVHSPHA